MQIRQLTVENLRIVKHLDIHPDRRINLIIGGNGAGKTSILEAVYLAGRGRSFRHQVAGPMIRDGESETTVVVRFSDDDSSDDGSVNHVLGIRRGRTGMQCRLDERDVTRRSTLAANLPTQWISSQPQVLLEGSPGIRRRFFDMGLFHVEHGYLAAYAEMTRILKQRNALLKARDPRGLSAWDKPFSDISKLLDSYREPYLADVFGRLLKILDDWGLLLDVDWRYRPGWDTATPFDDQLRKKRESDLRHGFTHIGPQRAEISIAIGGQSVERTLSRGQLKMVVFGLHLAQLDLLAKRRGVRPVLLVDDLGAELDQSNQRTLMQALESRSNQVFVTGITAPPVAGLPRMGMFHVEHGHLTKGEGDDQPVE